ncbi:DUF2960 domain-containing protein [Zobellella taiwanensis]|uniref:DUF2960 domain-containing protein n=1 Tax=Zobellella taiwanensis TaxID=347535 RepID=A0A2P7QX56_9GAMM|nr:DUF2960 family protein [Zobellella taiwanensis]PSJ42541.1 DUF2960 domain-containing protein [Zobellella taiwanensis]
MAFRIRYHYRKQSREIGYANDRHHSLYDAIAEAEGLDLGEFRRLETQLANISRNDRKTMKEFREEYFRKLGFSQISIVRDD